MCQPFAVVPSQIEITQWKPFASLTFRSTIWDHSAFLPWNEHIVSKEDVSYCLKIVLCHACIHAYPHTFILAHLHTSQCHFTSHHITIHYVTPHHICMTSDHIIIYIYIYRYIYIYTVYIYIYRHIHTMSALITSHFSVGTFLVAARFPGMIARAFYEAVLCIPWGIKPHVIAL
jgi:hypothetical protein